MQERPAPVAGMTISIRSRRDVVIMDPERFLAAARQACRELHPEATEAQLDAATTDVYDAVQLLLDRHSQLIPVEDGAGSTPEIGRGAPLPGIRIKDRPDGLSPAGWMQAVVVEESMPLQDYGCFLPADPFALPKDAPGNED
ncbi:hypothetical protein [Crossiella sp. CA198]|uniref:hypothetical protein n=1 Tax=Crossiella sp. CA198 TaxID=3455607 RepID=UPI003F8D769D